ncbi:MAG: helix-turn-helix transcriptional regulator [Bacillus sp. (in: firmicutes)]
MYYNGIGGVSRRQIFEDIKFMESDTGWSIPLERIKDGKRVYYRYYDSQFTINEQPLTDEEIRQLQTVIITLGRFRGLPCNEWVEEVISNLEWRFHLKGQTEDIIGFEQNPHLRGLHWLSMIIDAAFNHQALDVVYRTYKEDSRERLQTVHPYYVRQYNNRWFLLALDDEHQYISILALDRMLSLKVNESVPFVKNTDIDFSHYFDDVMGVTIPKDEVKKECIILRFTKKQFPYVVSKPLHHSQQILDEDECTLCIEVRPTYELQGQILSFGSDVEVLSPDSYREEIRGILENTLNKYLAMQKGCTDGQ